MTLQRFEHEHPQEYRLFIDWFFDYYNLWNIPGDNKKEKIDFLRTLPADFFCWPLMVYLNPSSKTNANEEFEKYLKEKLGASCSPQDIQH